MLSSVIFASILASAKPDFPHLTLLQRDGDKLTYAQAQVSVQGKLAIKNVWTIDRPSLRAFSARPGDNHLAIHFTESDDGSMLEVLTHATRPKVVATVYSNTGFTYSWTSGRSLEVGVDQLDATLQIEGGATLTLVKQSQDSYRYIKRKELADAKATVAAMSVLKPKFPPTLRGADPVRDVLLVPRNILPHAGFDQGLSAFALTVEGEKEAVEVRLYWQDSKKPSIRLHAGWPKTIAFGGGLVGLLYGNTCYLYSATSGKPLGSVPAEAIG